MACNLEANCNFLHGFFSCTLPEDTIDVDITLHNLKGIHTFRKDRNTQVIKCSPWTSKIKSFQSLQHKMVLYLRQREAATSPYANRSSHSRMKPFHFAKRPKATPTRKPGLIWKNFQNQGRLIWIQSWISPAELAHYSQGQGSRSYRTGPTVTHAAGVPAAPAQPVEAPAAQSPKPSKYCAICTPVRKLFPKWISHTHKIRLVRRFRRWERISGTKTWTKMTFLILKIGTVIC